MLLYTASMLHLHQDCIPFHSHSLPLRSSKGYGAMIEQSPHPPQTTTSTSKGATATVTAPPRQDLHRSCTPKSLKLSPIQGRCLGRGLVYVLTPGPRQHSPKGFPPTCFNQCSCHQGQDQGIEASAQPTCANITGQHWLKAASNNWLPITTVSCQLPGCFSHQLVAMPKTYC